MPRNLRPLLEGGIYHVFNRSISKKTIIFTEKQADIFIDCLKQALKRYNVNLLSFALMRNHYHFLVRTPNANLDKFMQYFASGLSRKINHSIGGDGPLFRSRYQSIVVETDEYLLQVMKYIHLNPVKAGIVDYPSLYKYSSAKNYLSDVSAPSWLNTNVVMGYFRNLKDIQEFHEGENNPKIEKFYSRKRFPATLNQNTIGGYF